MTPDNKPYNEREVELVVRRIDEKIDRLHEDIRVSSNYTEKRFQQVDKEIDTINAQIVKLQTFQTRAMTVWAFVVVLATLLINTAISFLK